MLLEEAHVIDGVTLMLLVLVNGASLAEQHVTGLTVDIHGLLVGRTLHHWLLFDRHEVTGIGNYIRKASNLVTREEFCKLEVRVSAPATEELATLSAETCGLVITVVTSQLYLGELLQLLLQVKEVIDMEDTW